MKKGKLFLPLSLALLSLPLIACTNSGEPQDTPDPGTTEPDDPTPAVDDTINWDEEKLGNPMVDPTNDNYRVMYEIFPISFSDYNGDGNGDIRGIINRLDYLNDGDMNSGKSLGVQGLWITPIHPSPTYHKYDVINYRKIDSTFGTMDDYEELLTKCHQRNVSVIMDLVINHTSSQNQWFLDFLQAQKDEDTENKYYNWYTWYPRTTTIHGEEVSGIPTGHTVSPIDGTNNYYECNFSSEMPELNYDNEEVYNEMVDVAKFWIDKGVDGFRFDAAKYIYYNDTSSNVTFWKKYINEIKEYAMATYSKDIYTVAEVWEADTACLPYIEALNCFSFTAAQQAGEIVTAVKSTNTYTYGYANYVVNYLKSAKEKNPEAMYLPFLSNHDIDRSAGFWSSKVPGQNKMGANLYILGPGSPFIYYGEEIGVKGSRGGASTDANRRLKMRWGNYGGFEDKVKNPIGSTYKEDLQVNGTVESQINSKSSLLTHYRHLIQLRLKYPEIARGDYEVFDEKGFKVTYNGSSLAILHNISTKEATIDITNYEFKTLADYIGSYARIEGNSLIIGPQTSIILK